MGCLPRRLRSGLSAAACSLFALRLMFVIFFVSNPGWFSLPCYKFMPSLIVGLRSVFVPPPFCCRSPCSSIWCAPPCSLLCGNFWVRPPRGDLCFPPARPLCSHVFIVERGGVSFTGGVLFFFLPTRFLRVGSFFAGLFKSCLIHLLSKIRPQHGGHKEFVVFHARVAPHKFSPHVWWS